MYFLDAYALIELAEGNPAYDEYYDKEIVTLKDNLAELYYYLLTRYNEQCAKFFFDGFSKIAVELPLEYVPEAMKLRKEWRAQKVNLSYVDCLGYMYALKTKRLFITGDRGFKDLKNVKIVR